MIHSGPRVRFSSELAVAELAARRAGQVILSHYQAAATGWNLKGDGSPVSRADIEANAVIVATLQEAFADDAILAEESPDDEGRLQCERVWIVDPLDGTRGFLARTDDFAVHVALVVKGLPMVSVVYQPVGDRLGWAVAGEGAFVGEAGTPPRRLRCSDRAAMGDLRIGVSRHNAPPALLAWLDAVGLRAQAVQVGASQKYVALAEGALDAVVTITPSEKEWDTCAPELLVHEAGGVVTDGDGQPLRYNQPSALIHRPRGILASNGRCHAELLQRIRS
ncbi:MAG TPA: 3'(2'),5'-bisphosphate nucleotidase CysQ, partial [Polyangia bacterium]